MRLIDADELEKRIWELRRQYQLMDDTQTADIIMHGLYRAKQVLDDIPTADAEPVKHGHWVKNGDRYCECSVCHHEGNVSGQDNYCWFCGAKMDVSDTNVGKMEVAK